MTRLIRLFLAMTVLIGVSARAETPSSARRNVEIEWDAVEGATAYEIQIIRKDDAKPKPIRFKLSQPSWRANVRPGEYTMQVRSYDDRGVPGNWSPASDLSVHLPSVLATAPLANAVVVAKEENSHEQVFTWEAVPNAARYHVRARTASGSWSSEKETTEPRWEVSLPVGDFVNWEVYAIDERGQPGEKWDAPLTFELRGPALQKPTIEKPISSYLKEIQWKAPAYAKTYTYDLQFKNPKTKKWTALERKMAYASNTLILDTSRPTGRYRLQVQANADHRGDSPVAKLEFEMMGNFHDPADLKNAILRESITKPTKYYTIASYLITQINYRALNYDANMKPSFQALGGTGRIGGGYQDAESKWGGFGIIDLSGFTIGGSQFQFASLEAHLTRKLEFGQGGLLLFGTGVFSKELPVVLGNSTDGLRGIGKVRGMGPHAGFTYWIPLSSHLGLQANARAYYTYLGSAPNGGEIKPVISFQYGLLGSYRLNKSWMGYAGYAYRADQAQFAANPSSTDSFASAGQVNEVSVIGHYLNLILEFSF